MLQFDPITHTYTVDGVRKISVTQVFDRVGVRNASDQPLLSIGGGEFCNSDRARTFGIEMHAICGYTINGIKCEYDPVFAPWVIGLNKFLDDYDLRKRIENRYTAKIYIAEKPLYSKLYGYCGTPDWFMAFNDFILLVDWKTCTALNQKMKYQVAAYAQLIKENYGLMRNNIPMVIVGLHENGYEPMQILALDQNTNFNKFLSLLNVYKTFAKE